MAYQKLIGVRLRDDAPPTAAGGTAPGVRAAYPTQQAGSNIFTQCRVKPRNLQTNISKFQPSTWRMSTRANNNVGLADDTTTAGAADNAEPRRQLCHQSTSRRASDPKSLQVLPAEQQYAHAKRPRIAPEMLAARAKTRPDPHQQTRDHVAERRGKRR